MSHSLSFHNIFNYLLVRPEEYNRSLSYREFADRAEIESFFNALHGFGNFYSICDAINEAGHRFLSWEKSTQVLADLVESGFYFVREVRHPMFDYGPSYDEIGLIKPGCWDLHPEHKEVQEEPLEEEPKQVELTWVKFRFVEDESGLPIGGLKTEITFSDDYNMKLKTSASGNLDIQQIAKGPCTLKCDLSGARLNNVDNADNKST